MTSTTAPSSSPPVMEGFVEYRWNLAPDEDGNERARRSDETNAAANIISDDEAFRQQPSPPEAGFYLVTNNNYWDHEENSCAYLLSVPQHLLKTVCDAARFQSSVRVSRYNVTPLTNTANRNTGDKQPTKKRRLEETSSTTRNSVILMEVLENGLELLSPLQHEKPDGTFLSLQQIFCEERELKKRHFNLQGIVDSISPIIVMDRTDPNKEPFALMELYDDRHYDEDESDDNTIVPWSCVVVLTGVTSLTCHQGIFPGDRIWLKQVKRQRWRKQDEILQKTTTSSRFRNRVPSHVFVVKDAQSVLWSRKPQPQTITPSLPSTPVPLVSLQGKVVSCSWARRGSHKGIHSVEIEIDGTLQQQKQSATTTDDTVRHVLFLLYYPMSPSLTLSLRPGAVIQAINIHRIGAMASFHSNSKININQREEASSPRMGQTIYYGACIRSTVSVLKMPPRDTSYQLRVPTRPFAIDNIQSSYLEYAFQHELRIWYNHANNLESTRRSGSLPSFEEIEYTWWKQQFSGGRKTTVTRDPYMEFFDHACDDDEGEIKIRQSYEYEKDDDEEEDLEIQLLERKAPRGCSCSQPEQQEKMNTGKHQPQMPKPSWVALHDVRIAGFRVMQNLLATTIGQSKMSQSTTDQRFKPQLGWTGSIHLSQAELVQSLAGHRSDDGNLSACLDSVALYTGGRVSNAPSSVATSSGPVDESLASASLANDHCVVPATTIQGQPYPDEKPGSHTFAVGKLHGIVMSCFCVGVEASPLSDTKRTGGKTEFKSGDSTQTEGSGTGTNVSRIIPLPHHGDDDALKNKSSKDGGTPPLRFGACSLFHADGFLFVLSIQLVFTTLVPIASKSRLVENGKAKATTISFRDSEVDVPLKHCTIRQCLDPDEVTKIADNMHITSILGMQVRQRFRLSKITDNRYRGCILTLSHIPVFNHRSGTRNSGPTDVSSLQSIEVKATLHFKKAANKRSYLWREITRLLQSNALFAMDDATLLALAFWNIADTADTCALTAGGWDDALGRPPTKRGHSQAFNVVVQLPGKVVQGPDARGYERFACSMSQIRARFVQFENDNDGGATQKKDEGLSAVPESLSAIGGLKFLPGMLDRRPRRCNSTRGSTGQIPEEALHCLVGKGPLVGFPPAAMSGVPECRIVDLLRAICLDLQAQQSLQASETRLHHMAPSLVRRVTGARFLGASFCQAQAMCGKCFKALCQPKGSSRKKENRKQSARNKKQGWDSQKQTTFWHCPLPMATTGKDESSASASKVSEESAPVTISKSRGSGAMKSSTLLCCPNGCSVPIYAEIKWECSGTLDDGTGQAKLHAEREAATTLLGMDQNIIAMIEEGVWKSRDGIILFSKTSPPPSHLAKAVEAANFVVTAREKDRKKHPKRRGRSEPATRSDEALQLMEPEHRALYLMIQECRRVHQSHHRMDFMVRCKPLSDAVVHLNHTEIDVVAPGKHEGSCSPHPTATYSLVPLKLNLVDCSIASRGDIVGETWDILKSL